MQDSRLRKFKINQQQIKLKYVFVHNGDLSLVAWLNAVEIFDYI